MNDKQIFIEKDKYLIGGLVGGLAGGAAKLFGADDELTNQISNIGKTVGGVGGLMFGDVSSIADIGTGVTGTIGAFSDNPEIKNAANMAGQGFGLASALTGGFGFADGGKIPEGDPIQYNSPEYNRAYNNGTLVTEQDGNLMAAMLPEVTVRASEQQPSLNSSSFKNRVYEAIEPMKYADSQSMAIAGKDILLGASRAPIDYITNYFKGKKYKQQEIDMIADKYDDIENVEYDKINALIDNPQTANLDSLINRYGIVSDSLLDERFKEMDKVRDKYETDPIFAEKYPDLMAEEMWRKFLDVDPIFEDSIVESSYKPTDAKDKDAKYFTNKNLKDPEFRSKLLHKSLKSKEPKEFPYQAHSTDFGAGRGIGNFKIDKGEDEYGTYISMYDVYDFGSGLINKVANAVGTPYDIYDRIYYAEKDGMLREVSPNKAADKQFSDNDNSPKLKYGGSLNDMFSNMYADGGAMQGSGGDTQFNGGFSHEEGGLDLTNQAEVEKGEFQYNNGEDKYIFSNNFKLS